MNLNILKENRISTIYKLAKTAFGDYRKQIIALIGLGFLGGILEGIGINAIIPLFSFVTKDTSAPTDIISRSIEKFFQFFHIPFVLKYMLILIALLFIFKAIATFFSRYITDTIKASYVKNTRVKLFNMYLKSSWTFLSKQRIGYIEKVLTTDVDNSSSLLTLITNVTILLVNIAVYVFIAFNISSTITLITLAIGGVIFLVFKPLMHKVKVISERSGIVMKEASNHVNESMIGIKTIKSMALESRVVKKSVGFFDEWKHIVIKLSVFSNLVTVGIQPVSILLILTIFSISYKTSSFEFASFAVIIFAINKIFAYIQQGQIQLHNINAMYPFLRTVVEYEETAIKNKEEDTGKNSFNFKNKLIFSDISFSYKEAPTLSNINISIPKGKIIGIIGPSGSGKTTFVDLLLRLIQPDNGEILLDEDNIKNIKLNDWKENIGYVSQNIFLTNDTIRNNITFYDNSITQKDIIKASKMANIYDFVMSLPDKFDTEVGEQGSFLSGGQRQRVALARVLARKPKILILDEATSALDNESQSLIQDSIQSLRGKITIIIIAHRPTTVMGVDNLIVLENGKIVEKGKPEEMLKNKNSYFNKINDLKI